MAIIGSLALWEIVFWPLSLNSINARADIPKLLIVPIYN